MGDNYGKIEAAMAKIEREGNHPDETWKPWPKFLALGELGAGFTGGGGAGGEAEPRRETSGNKCRWSHFHAAMIDSRRYVCSALVQFLIFRVLRSSAASTEDLSNVEFEKDEFMSLRLWFRCSFVFEMSDRIVDTSSLLWLKKCSRLWCPLFPMNWYYICLLSCFVSVVCLGLLISAPFAMPSDCEVTVSIASFWAIWHLLHTVHVYCKSD